MTVFPPFKKSTMRPLKPIVFLPKHSLELLYEARRSSEGPGAGRHATLDKERTHAASRPRRREDARLRRPVHQAERPAEFVRTTGDLQPAILVSDTWRHGGRFSRIA